jgi:hypothetical protein
MEKARRDAVIPRRRAPHPERKIMTTLEIMADTPSAIHNDFVSTDAADLASHMDQCAHSRGRFFGLQSGLQSAHSVMSPAHRGDGRPTHDLSFCIVAIAALPLPMLPSALRTDDFSLSV